MYFSDSSAPRRQVPIPDELFQQVLSFCDGVTLANLVQVCRDWYVAGHQPELWRDVVLRQCGETLLEFEGKSWKDVYVHQLVGKVARPHVPMALGGVYSEHYYRTHLCRSFAIPASWMTVAGGSIERVTKQLSAQEFFHNYEEQNRPVVLAGVAKTWRAMQKWTDMDYLQRVTQNRTFRATSGAAPLPANFTLQAYHQYCRAAPEEAPLYLFDRNALLETPLQEDYYPDLQRTCPFWDPARPPHDLFQYLGMGRPDHTWLICGPKRSGSAFHMDPNATHAWNAAILGRKRWIFYPPGVTPPGVHPSPSGEHVAMPISVGEWLLNYYVQEHLPNLSNPNPSERPLECTVEPGDVIFVPHGWWHMVINLDDVNLAITHNYVSLSNLPTVLRFMERKEEQISGCRDRAESIKPEFIKKAFEKALEEHGHGAWLKDAQNMADRGWLCRAWTDDNQDTPACKAAKKNNRKRRRDTCEGQAATSDRSIMAKAKQSMGQTGFSFSFL